jgi:transcriptional regulator with XRE-family HTH domain
METTDDAVATRVAQARKLAGMTQRELATRANVPVGLVRSVEQRRAPATAAFLGAVSKALRVNVADLTGQPFRPAPGQDVEIHAAIAGLPTELAAYDIDACAVVAPRTYERLKSAVDRICVYRRNASFHRLGQDLLPLMAEVRAALHRRTGHERDQAAGLLCELYYSAHSLAHKLGYTDLAATAVDRLAWSAAESGSSLWIATAQFQRAAMLTAGGDWSAPARFLERCRSDIEPRREAGLRADLIAWGGLHLQSGLAASRWGRRDLADAHLTEARETARRLGDDRDTILSFGPTNVEFWAVALAVEAMEPGEALRRADTVVIPAGTPKERAGHYYMDLSRAWLLHGDRARSLEALRADTVHGLAAWCGIADRV